MDEITIKLPVSGKDVVIRNYTTRKDDARASALLHAGVTAEQKSLKDQSVKFSFAAVIASKESYVYRLVKSIDGNKQDITTQLEDLRSEDYEAIEEAVDKIVEEHSPKAKMAKENVKKD